MRILTFGELLLRLTAPGYTRLFQKDTLEATFCGAEANVAVSLANFGLESVYVTKLPDNPAGRAAANSLRYFGVDTDRIVYGGERLGLYYLEKGASQRPSKVIYDRKHSSIAEASADEFDWDKLFDGVDWFHWSGINPALSDELAATCMKACRAARDKGITVSCDLNYRSTLWEQEKAKEVMSSLMQYVDVCIGNEEDADKVLGIRSEKSDVEHGKLNVDGYSEVCREICHQYGCRQVAFTLRESYSASINGWSGILYDSVTDKTILSPKYELQIVDRVGGGDSFSAGLIYALSSGHDCGYAIGFATAASCLKHSMEGDFNRVTVAEVENLMQHGGNGRVVR